MGRVAQQYNKCNRSFTQVFSNKFRVEQDDFVVNDGYIVGGLGLWQSQSYFVRFCQMLYENDADKCCLTATRDIIVMENNVPAQILPQLYFSFNFSSQR